MQNPPTITANIELNKIILKGYLTRYTVNSVWGLVNKSPKNLAEITVLVVDQIIQIDSAGLAFLSLLSEKIQQISGNYPEYQGQSQNLTDLIAAYRLNPSMQFN